MVSAFETRSKFLRSLGIVHPDEESRVTAERSCTRTFPEDMCVDNEDVRKSTDDDHVKDAPQLSAAMPDSPTSVRHHDLQHVHSPSATTLPAQKKGVSFVGFVRVRWIPSRHDYSPTAKATLWTTRDEIYENASRNTIEYASEGWDINQVLEDERMVDYFGQKIHPVHFRAEIDRKAYLCNVMEKRRLSKKQRTNFVRTMTASS